MKIRKEIKWFAEKMEKVLRENDDKAEWEKSSVKYLSYQLGENFHELQADMLGVIYSSPLHLVKCCVDIANYCMMIADNEKNGR